MNKGRSDLLITRTIIMMGALAAATAFSFNSSPSDVNAVGQQQEQYLKTKKIREGLADFRQVAKETIPAVVSIKVQSKKKGSIFGDRQDTFDLFGDDFWGFFNLPKQDLGRSQPVIGQGSGVIVKPDGYILTNSHVVHEMDTITVQLNDGREFSATLLGEDPNSDLAVIKVDGQDLPYIPFGNSDDLEVGEWVAAIGNPLGLQATLTTGVVSAKSRNNLDVARYEDFIQTDAAINRGNSGGALVDLEGRLVGINTAIATNASAGYMGIGFAIPSNMARHVLDEIVTDGKVQRGFLGVALQSMNYQLAQAFGLKKVEGAIVANVVKGSPAEQAGIQVEDVILKYNDHPVENSGSLRNAISMMRPGSTVVLSILRKEQHITLPITIGNQGEAGASVSDTSHQKSLGIEVENLTPEVAKSLGYTQDQGVVVNRVQPDSAAGIVGIKKGALILGVNRQKIANVQEFNQAMANREKGKPVLLQIKQGENYLFVSIQAD